MAKNDMGPSGSKDGAPTKSEQNGGKPNVGFSSPPNQDSSSTTGDKPGTFGENSRRAH
jgi:hypothetical protein